MEEQTVGIILKQKGNSALLVVVEDSDYINNASLEVEE